MSHELELLDEHLERYPLITPTDLYKLAHQACLGPGHLLDHSTERMVRDALASEVRSLDLEPRAWEDAVELLHPDSEMARVHLRPFVRAGGEVGRLADALIATVEEVGDGDKDALGTMLGAFRQGLQGRALSWETSAFDALLRTQIEAGLTLVSHSDTYREAYDPHYRVVLLKTLA